MLNIASVASSARRTALGPAPDLDQVFARYVEPVHRFLYSRLGNREDAEDLTSEVFLRAARTLDRERPEASIASWLFTVARTVLADHWRRYYRTGSLVSIDDVQVADAPVRLDEPGTSERSARLVEETLARLPDRYRQVLELRFLQGYSIAETAAELDLSSENVKVIQHRALAKAVQLAKAQQ